MNSIQKVNMPNIVASVRHTLKLRFCFWFLGFANVVNISRKDY